MTKSWLVSVLYLIGLKGSASFLDQSLSEVKKNHAILDYLRSSIDNCLHYFGRNGINGIWPSHKNKCLAKKLLNNYSRSKSWPWLRVLHYVSTRFGNRKNSLHNYFATYFHSMVSHAVMVIVGLLLRSEVIQPGILVHKSRLKCPERWIEIKENSLG